MTEHFEPHLILAEIVLERLSVSGGSGSSPERMIAELESCIQEFMKLPDYVAVLDADEGDTRALEEHLIAGGELSELGRRWLAAHLAGRLRPKRRGIKRTKKQSMADMNAVIDVVNIKETGGIGQSAAVKSFLEAHPNKNEETLRSQLKRGLADFGKAKLSELTEEKSDD